MAEYKSMYLHLFNAVTDSLENMAEQNFGQAAACLRQAQQTCEKLYMDGENPEADG